MPNIAVLIVESLSDADVKEKRTEGAMLNQSLRLAGIASRNIAVADRGEFVAALKTLESPVDASDVVALHLSCHGNDRGITLMSGETVSWYELRRMLVPLNRCHSGRLVVCMSVCKGLFGAGMALDPNELPFRALVGPVTNVRFCDAAVAFIVFYHQLSRDESIDRAVELAILASGEQRFGVVEGEPTRQALLDAIAEIEAGA